MTSKASQIKLLACAALFALGASSSAVADDTTDLYFQQVIDRYYNFPTTARVFGMGGSTALTSIDSSAIVGNPAGLGFMKQGELSGTYRYDTVSGDEFPTGRGIEQNTNSGSGLLAMPVSPLTDALPEYGNLGLGWTGANGNWDDDSFDTHTKQIHVSGAYAVALSDDLSVGYALGWTRDKLQSDKIFNYPMANGFRHTLGALYKVDPSLTLGSTLLVGHGTHHALFGPGTDGVSDTFQVGIGFGGEYRMEQTTVAASIDYNHLKTDGDVESSIPANFVGGDEQGDTFNVRVGVEQGLGENFVVRGGYRFAGLENYTYDRSELGALEGSAYYNAFSLGAGVLFNTDWHYVPQVKLDYGVEYRAVGNDDWEHVITLTLPFDLCAAA